jgi:hypothetical protein
MQDASRLAEELRRILLQKMPHWPKDDLATATSGVAAGIQVDGGLGIWTADPPEWRGPYRTHRADGKPVYETPNQHQAVLLAQALNEVTWARLKAAKKLDLEHFAFLNDLADWNKQEWLPVKDSVEIRRLADALDSQIHGILEDEASLRQRALPDRLRQVAERLERRGPRRSTGERTEDPPG